ncbi:MULTISPECIES: response regulator [unclassified Imperialibacter]|uniref:response regulator n=1 Tax=unclassified Imperialibacter TaxID=2629706 RepID=UPI001259B378|nr:MULTISPECIES: response regulator [unclassified Imperialibacter]CAD5265500.1 Transcriptional regulator [Imperialibacter sp. 89]CAD5270336.1 Transcriptional regulator [Imperialibacter sp. 75]VVT09972.1 Transcriptional regulator, Crp/Fnr family [Imperialibacter sp. EC-SDR9]
MDQTILVIDDCEEIADNISEILQLAHYRVLTASNGKTGVELAKKEFPDLILCDVSMPELDGHGVLYILNSEPETAQIPFVFLTGKTDHNDLKTAMSLGADGYVTKPFSATELLEIVRIRLKKRLAQNPGLRGDSNNINLLFNEAREAKAVDQLLAGKPMRTFRKREFIFMEGQTNNEVFFIRKGKIKTYKLNYEGKELITGIYKVADFLGHIYVLEERPNQESAEAMEESELVIVPKVEFINAVYASKELARKFIKLLAGTIEQTENRLLDLAYQSVRQRVARSLITLCEPIPYCFVSVSRRDMSNLIGTATESLNRTLADFKDEGLVEILNNGIKILNKAKLERLAQ